jgi:predicted permease
MRWWRINKRDADLERELQSDLELEEEEQRERGLSSKEAHYAALRAFGNPSLIREQTRAVWSWNGLENLLRDLRIGVRTLFRSPGFSIIAVLVMALCIGATTSLFTVVRSVLLRPLPFRDPSHLVMLFDHFRDPSMNAQGFNYKTVAAADFYDWQTQTHGFEGMAAWRWSQFNLTGERGELPELVSARGGTWNLFPLLGVPAAIGRTFLESEDRPDGNAVMLTWSLFERRFGGDPSIVGRQIHLDGKLYTVVGVLPQWFAYPDASVQVWVTFASGVAPSVLERHDFHFSHVVARLRPDVSLANALGQVGAVQYSLHMQNLNAPVAEDVASRTINDDLARDVRKPLQLLMCAVACLLLIGCLNVANLLVARGAARQKEMAIRGALGARRLTLIRAQLAESLLICLAGGVGGVLLSLAATKWLASAWKDLPSAEGIQVDGVVLGFACALIFAAALVAGLLPAISSTGKAVFAVLQSSSRIAGGSLSSTAIRKTLLTAEIAVTVVLLIAAGLLLKTFVRLRATNLGCATENVLTMSYSQPPQRYDSPAKVNAFNETLLQRVRALPGVRTAAIGSTVPGTGSGSDDTFTILEHPPLAPSTAMPAAMTRWIDPQYFSALQIPLLSGRFFTGDDRAGRPKTAILNRQLAKQYFPGEDPLGKHLHLVAKEWGDYQVVGVVADTLQMVGQPALPAMYFPLLNGGNHEELSLAVRTASDPLAMSIPIQKQIAALDPEMPVHDVLTMDEIVGQSLGNQSLSASLVLAFAVLALVLASVGLYGVLSYLTMQRRAEIGVRMALGAQREQVMRQMLGEGLRPALYGLVLGLAVSAGAVRLIQSMLYGTQPLDPAIFAAVATTLLLVAALACLVPAWTASRIDPMQALRTE